METVRAQDLPSTGLTPKPAVVYITTPEGLFVGAVLVVDFYEDA